MSTTFFQWLRVPHVTSLIAAAVLLLAGSTSLSAQQTHVLIITGLGGDPQYRAKFHTVGASLHQLARESWGVPAASALLLREAPGAYSAGAARNSRRDDVDTALRELAARSKPGDQVFIFLHGHGSGEGADSRVNLPGPDPTAAEYNTWLDRFPRQTVVFVNAASASGDFLPVLAGPSRVIITATKSAFQRNATLFAEHFAQGLSSGEADANKDGRTTVLEAFTYADREVARAYESDKRWRTENAQLSDSTLAATVSFGRAVVAANPQVAALLAERRALEEQVAALRARRDSMDAEAYEAELERLVLAIAEKTQAIRAAGGTP